MAGEEFLASKTVDQVPAGTFEAGVASAYFAENDTALLRAAGSYVIKTESDALSELLAAYQAANIPIRLERLKGKSIPRMSFEELTEEDLMLFPNERSFGLECAIGSPPLQVPIKKGRSTLSPVIDMRFTLPDRFVPVIGKLSDYLALDLSHRAEIGQPLLRDPQVSALTQSTAVRMLPAWDSRRALSLKSESNPEKIFTIGYDSHTEGVRLTTVSIHERLAQVALMPIIMPNQGKYAGASIFPRGPYV